jgi:hypothetical protein
MAARPGSAQFVTGAGRTHPNTIARLRVRRRLGLVGAAGEGVEEGVERPLWTRLRTRQRAVHDSGRDVVHNV